VPAAALDSPERPQTIQARPARTATVTTRKATFFMRVRLAPDLAREARGAPSGAQPYRLGGYGVRVPVMVATTLMPADPSDVSWTRSKLTTDFW
jgi:hypothetical protein